MFYHIASLLKQDIGFFNILSYLSTRSVLALFTSLAWMLFFGQGIINKLHSLKYSQSIRTDGPETHLKKKGTPTMGGVLVLEALTVSTLLWANLFNPYVWILLFVTLGFALVGFIDDMRKIELRNSDGLSAKNKYLGLSIVALIACFLIYFAYNGTNATALVVPFFKQFTPQLGIFFIVLAYFTIVGSSNAVNLTDGLDGLAIVPVVFCSVGFGIIAWLTGNSVFANYLHILYIPNTAEISILCASLIGAGIGFFWFNSYPAAVFMGDVGSLAFGGFLGTVAVLVRQEFLLVIMGGVFVAETLSTMLQVTYFRYTKKKFGEGRRLFLMAPLHHHFEKKGLSETKVIARFWVVSFILLLVALITFKIR